MAGTTDIGGVRPSHAGRRSAGRYVLGDLLGRGGMAEVFSGHSLGEHGFQKPVAIKRLLPELASDEVFVERLIEEAKLLVGMQHGNIVSVIDLARDGDDVFLVMEFVDGPSLRQLLKARSSRGLPLGAATYVVQSAAAGLAFAHQRPGGAIIHADISPSNLLLTTSGEVRVADFGIARREGGGHGVVEGKWAYMAPEQARGEPLTPRSDVFALGVVLYELICGAHPFGQAVTHQERDRSPMRVIPPRLVKPSVPAGIDAICMRALAHDPRDRYRGMQELIDALVEERFTNHWREGAADLATLIRGGGPSATSSHPVARTVHTDRPVTIATRSLIREITPVARAGVGTPQPERRSVSELGSEPASQYSAYSAIASSGARTTSFLAADEQSHSQSYSYASAGEPASQPSIAGTPAVAGQAYQPLYGFDAVPASPRDLDRVVGGVLAGGPPPVAVDGRSTRWTFAVLGLAALAGVVAAVAFQVRGTPQALAEDRTGSDAPLVAPPALVPVDTAPAPTAVAAAATEPATPPPAPAPAPTVPDVVAPAPVTATPAPVTPTPAPTPVARPPRRERPTPRRERPARPVEVAEVEPGAGAKRTGVLVVHTVPSGVAVIAGYPSREVPGRFELPAGRYTVKVTNKLTQRTKTLTGVVVTGEETKLICSDACWPE